MRSLTERATLECARNVHAGSRVARASRARADRLGGTDLGLADRHDFAGDGAGEVLVDPKRVLRKLPRQQVTLAAGDAFYRMPHIAVGARLADPSVIHERRERVPCLMQAEPLDIRSGYPAA